MTATVYEMAYALTDSETQKGMKLTCKPLYAGKWRVAAFTYSFVHGMALGVTAIGLSFLLARQFGNVPGDAVYLIYVFFIIFTLAYWLLERSLKKRNAEIYRTSLLMQNQTLLLSAAGITFNNARSKSFFDWRDVSGLVENSEMIVAALGSHGVVMPDRILALAGDAGGIRDQIKDWHSTAGRAT
jgi:hypothetical protein